MSLHRKRWLLLLYSLCSSYSSCNDTNPGVKKPRLQLIRKVIMVFCCLINQLFVSAMIVLLTESPLISVHPALHSVGNAEVRRTDVASCSSLSLLRCLSSWWDEASRWVNIYPRCLLHYVATCHWAFEHICCFIFLVTGWVGPGVRVFAQIYCFKLFNAI